MSCRRNLLLLLLLQRVASLAAAQQGNRRVRPTYRGENRLVTSAATAHEVLCNKER